jgi:hypothetical protein
MLVLSYKVKLERIKNMSDFLDYMDEIYEELVEEFGHEIESKCIHE